MFSLARWESFTVSWSLGAWQVGSECQPPHPPSNLDRKSRCKDVILQGVRAGAAWGLQGTGNVGELSCFPCGGRMCRL